jgi:hypothetical protein
MDEKLPGLMLIAAVLLYLLPSFVAEFRNHRNKGAIVVLDLLLGWTFIGWVIAICGLGPRT